MGMMLLLLYVFGVVSAPAPVCRLLHGVDLCWPPTAVSNWTCSQIKSRTLAPGVQWTQQRCQLVGQIPWYAKPPIKVSWGVGPLVFNQVEVDMTQALVVPGTPDPKTPVAALNEIARWANNGTTPNLLAGINGGYFFRLDESGFVDNVCFGKMREQALQPVDPKHPSQGPSDTLIKLNGRYLGTNCDNVGFSRPAVLVVNGTSSYIKVVGRGEDIPTAYNALAASPLLLSSQGGVVQVDIPADDADVNIGEHAACTAVGLRGGHTLVMVTADGIDDCDMNNATCGIASWQFAYYLKDALNLTSALEMDQGGSTTFWVAGEARDGVVNENGSGGHSTGPYGPEAKARNIYDGLFVLAR